MSKKLIRIVIALLGFCLAVIIVFQFFWIKNALNVKEEQFDRTVSAFLGNIVDKIKTREVVAFISDKCGNNQADIDTLISMYGKTSDSVCKSLKCFRITSSISDIDTVGGIDPVFPGQNDDAEEEVNSRQKLIINNNDTSSVIKFIAYSDGSDTVISTSRLRYRFDQFINVMDKLVIEFSNRDEPVEKKIDQATWDSLLRVELKRNELPANYEFAVTNNENKDSFSVKSPGFKTEMKNTRYRTNLFNGEFQEKTDELLLFFPDRIGFILKSSWLVLLGSLLFSLVIIATFSWTIHVILRQKKISDIKSDFINNMTHEFKTPIATISLAADAIADQRVIIDPEQVMHFTQVIKEENNRMNSSVEHVLQMALFDKKEFGLDLKKTDINLLAGTAVDKMALIIENREGTITLSTQAAVSVVDADPVHLLNVLLNLLDNANKYSKEKPEIHVSTMNISHSVVISVTDKGIGMSREAQSKIFERFYRVATGNIHNVKGFGLGLSYCKAIVLAHSGIISVSSEPLKGSTFEITLPLSGNVNGNPPQRSD